MNVVDSSGWLEYFADANNGQLFAPIIQDTKKLIIPTICIYEVFKRVFSERGEESALQAIGIMSHGIIAALTREIAIESAQLSIELNLAMADSIILATAYVNQATLWTQDADFKDIAGVKYIPKV
jgi:toxin FitB